MLICRQVDDARLDGVGFFVFLTLCQLSLLVYIVEGGQISGAKHGTLWARSPVQEN